MDVHALAVEFLFPTVDVGARGCGCRVSGCGGREHTCCGTGDARVDGESMRSAVFDEGSGACGSGGDARAGFPRQRHRGDPDAVVCLEVEDLVDLGRVGRVNG